jgi:DNA-binding MarR family transcriptional regulator
VDEPKGRLRDEIRQTKPFRSLGQEAMLGLLRTANLLRHRIAAVTEPHGLTVQQYNVLRILRGAGDEPLPTLEIGERMIEQSPGVTRLLDRLEAQGFVSRERCREDRRQVLCRITPAGLELLCAMDPDVDELEASALEVLEPAEQEALIGLLDRVRAAYR